MEGVNLLHRFLFHGQCHPARLTERLLCQDIFVMDLAPNRRPCLVILCLAICSTAAVTYSWPRCALLCLDIFLVREVSHSWPHNALLALQLDWPYV
eukprot:scaffold83120_cov20-Tisochrysis_lutea.AAC.2